MSIVVPHCTGQSKGHECLLSHWGREYVHNHSCLLLSLAASAPCREGSSSNLPGWSGMGARTSPMGWEVAPPGSALHGALWKPPSSWEGPLHHDAFSGWDILESNHWDSFCGTSANPLGSWASFRKLIFRQVALEFYNITHYQMV